MFTLYGISGPIHRGPLESMDHVRPLARASAVAATAVGGGEAGASAVAQTAVRAYRDVLREDLDRGPLRHAVQVMHSPVVTVADDDAVADAWRVLRDHRIRQAPVLDASGKLVGIVSERDLLTAIDIDGERVIETLRRQVRDVMTTPVVAALPATDLRHIAAAMLDHGVDGVPIVDESGQLLGFISRRDVLHAVVTEPPLSLWR